jgi:hypothetical protein
MFYYNCFQPRQIQYYDSLKQHVNLSSYVNNPKLQAFTTCPKTKAKQSTYTSWFKLWELQFFCRAIFILNYFLHFVVFSSSNSIYRLCRIWLNYFPQFFQIDLPRNARWPYRIDNVVNCTMKCVLALYGFNLWKHNGCNLQNCTIVV